MCALFALAFDVSRLVQEGQRLVDLHEFLDILVTDLLEFNPDERSEDQLMPTIVGSLPILAFAGDGAEESLNL